MNWGQIFVMCIAVIGCAVGALYTFIPDAHQQACDYLTGPVGQNIYASGGPLAEIIKYPMAVCVGLGLSS